MYGQTVTLQPRPLDQRCKSRQDGKPFNNDLNDDIKGASLYDLIQISAPPMYSPEKNSVDMKLFLLDAMKCTKLNSFSERQGDQLQSQTPQQIAAKNESYGIDLINGTIRVDLNGKEALERKRKSQCATPKAQKSHSLHDEKSDNDNEKVQTMTFQQQAKSSKSKTPMKKSFGNKKKSNNAHPFANSSNKRVSSEAKHQTDLTPLRQKSSNQNQYYSKGHLNKNYTPLKLQVDRQAASREKSGYRYKTSKKLTKVDNQESQNYSPTSTIVQIDLHKSEVQRNSQTPKEKKPISFQQQLHRVKSSKEILINPHSELMHQEQKKRILKQHNLVVEDHFKLIQQSPLQDLLDQRLQLLQQADQIRKSNKSVIQRSEDLHVERKGLKRSVVKKTYKASPFPDDNSLSKHSFKQHNDQPNESDKSHKGSKNNHINVMLKNQQQISRKTTKNPTRQQQMKKAIQSLTIQGLSEFQRIKKPQKQAQLIGKLLCMLLCAFRDPPLTSEYPYEVVSKEFEKWESILYFITANPTRTIGELHSIIQRMQQKNMVNVDYIHSLIKEISDNEQTLKAIVIKNLKDIYDLVQKTIVYAEYRLKKRKHKKSDGFQQNNDLIDVCSKDASTFQNDECFVIIENQSLMDIDILNSKSFDVFSKNEPIEILDCNSSKILDDRSKINEQYEYMINQTSNASSHRRHFSQISNSEDQDDISGLDKSDLICLDELNYRQVQTEIDEVDFYDKIEHRAKHRYNGGQQSAYIQPKTGSQQNSAQKASKTNVIESTQEYDCNQVPSPLPFPPSQYQILENILGNENLNGFKQFAVEGLDNPIQIKVSLNSSNQEAVYLEKASYSQMAVGNLLELNEHSANKHPIFHKVEMIVNQEVTIPNEPTFNDRPQRYEQYEDSEEYDDGINNIDIEVYSQDLVEFDANTVTPKETSEASISTHQKPAHKRDGFQTPKKGQEDSRDHLQESPVKPPSSKKKDKKELSPTQKLIQFKNKAHRAQKQTANAAKFQNHMNSIKDQVQFAVKESESNIDQSIAIKMIQRKEKPTVKSQPQRKSQLNTKQASPTKELNKNIYAEDLPLQIVESTVPYTIELASNRDIFSYEDKSSNTDRSNPNTDRGQESSSLDLNIGAFGGSAIPAEVKQSNIFVYNVKDKSPDSQFSIKLMKVEDFNEAEQQQLQNQFAKASCETKNSKGIDMKTIEELKSRRLNQLKDKDHAYTASSLAEHKVFQISQDIIGPSKIETKFVASGYSQNPLHGYERNCVQSVIEEEEDEGILDLAINKNYYLGGI